MAAGCAQHWGTAAPQASAPWAWNGSEVQKGTLAWEALSRLWLTAWRFRGGLSASAAMLESPCACARQLGSARLVRSDLTLVKPSACLWTSMLWA